MATLKELRAANHATTRALEAAQQELEAKRLVALDAQEHYTTLVVNAINDEDITEEDIQAAAQAVKTARADLAAVRRALKPREVDDPPEVPSG
jgi:predicted methyltransferase